MGLVALVCLCGLCGLLPGRDGTDQPTHAPATATAFERIKAQVVEVVDGDTIKVAIEGQVYSVRYIGIDTPESVHPDEPVEWMGPEASEANRQLVEGRTVYLERDVSETDRYGRLLRYVFLEDGTFVNAELVRLGYALVSTYPPDVRYQDLFLRMQEEAREAGRGLWGTMPTPAPGDVRIAYVYYDGQVAQVESDEYAVVENAGGVPVDLAGWRLNAGGEGEDFWFPKFVLGPGRECRVYTNEHHPERCGFSFGSSTALWRNSGDCGHLYDADGTEDSTYCY